jgi:hypothetical protein
MSSSDEEDRAADFLDDLYSSDSDDAELKMPMAPAYVDPHKDSDTVALRRLSSDGSAPQDTVESERTTADEHVVLDPLAVKLANPEMDCDCDMDSGPSVPPAESAPAGKGLAPLEAALALCDSGITTQLLAARTAHTSASLQKMLTGLCSGDYEGVVGSQPARWLLGTKLADDATNTSAMVQGSTAVDTDDAPPDALRQQGNELFAAAQLEMAHERYSAAIAGATSQLATDDMSADEASACKTCRLLCRSNRAACYLKLHYNAAAIQDCTDVLSEDDANVKALFRRGQAYLALQLPSRARVDLHTAAKLAPQDKAIRSFLKKLPDGTAPVTLSNETIVLRDMLQRVSRTRMAALSDPDLMGLAIDLTPDEVGPRAGDAGGSLSVFSPPSWILPHVILATACLLWLKLDPLAEKRPPSGWACGDLHRSRTHVALCAG